MPVSSSSETNERSKVQEYLNNLYFLKQLFNTYKYIKIIYFSILFSMLIEDLPHFFF